MTSFSMTTDDEIGVSINKMKSSTCARDPKSSLQYPSNETTLLEA